MKSIHHGKILKQVVTRMWDTLPSRERAIIAADMDRETELGKWFNATVMAEANSKYESATCPLNDPYSFRYEQETPPAGWPA